MANSPADIGAVDARAAGKIDGSNEKQKLTSYLAVVGDDPDQAGAYEALKALARQGDPARLGLEPLRVVKRARELHEARGELWVVAELLEVEAILLAGDAPRAAAAWKEIAKLRAEELLDAEGARAAYQTAQRLTPDDHELDEALRRIEQTEKSWRKFAKRFIEEARSGSDVGLQTTLLLRAATLVFQYKKRRDAEIDVLFREVLRVDPTHRRGVLLFEQALRQREAWPQLAEHMTAAAEHAPDAGDAIAFSTRAARAFVRAQDPERAAACYAHVLGADPTHGEALAFLSKHLTKQGRWDDLAAMYDGALRGQEQLDPGRSRELLVQVAMLHWRMRGDPAAAERYFARLRKLEPADPQVLDFYREQYASPERAEAWFAVLSDAYRVSSDERQKIELAAAMAETTQASAPLRERTADAWKLVHRLDPENPRALAELKALYTRGQKWNALADVIKAELDSTPDGAVAARLSALRELLAVYRDRLHMDGMVVGTLSRIVKLAPDDLNALAELTDKYERAGRYNDLINLLSEHAETLADPAQRVAAHVRVARLWIDRFSNYGQATAPLERALGLDPSSREVLELLKSIYTKKRAWKSLYDVLRRERTATTDAKIKLANTIEMAQLASDRLQSHADAIALWKEAIALDPAAPGALEALEKLADGEGDHATLIAARELEYRQAQTDETRIRVLQKLALSYSERLGQHAQAIECWRRILELDPKHGRATRAVRDHLLKAGDWDGIEALYRGVGDAEGLVDVLAQESDRTSDPALKVQLSFRAARVFENDIGDPARALRSYERVLSADPANVVAAGKLAAIFEADAKWTRLRGVLEILLRAESDPERRLELLLRTRALCLTQLRDGEAAFAHAAQAYRLFPERPELREQLESAAEAAAGFERLIELYLERAEAAPPAEALALRRTVARTALDRLGKERIAEPQLQKILAAEPSDTSVMDALERIYRAAQQTAELRGLLMHRVAHDADPLQRKRALKELAQLAEAVFHDPDAAAAHYRALSELDPEDRDVLLARDRLALAAERWPELGEILERRMPIEEHPSARAELATRLGLLQNDRLDQPQRALDSFEAVAAHHPLSGAAIDAIERIAGRGGELESRAGDLLARVYQDAGRYDKLRAVLQRRLKAEKNEDAIRHLRLQVAEISSVNLGDLTAAYSSLETAFLEQPADHELWDRLAQIAKASGQQPALAVAYATAVEAGELDANDRLELARRTAQLYEHVLGQPSEAETFHRHVLKLDPLDEPAFAGLKQLYTGAERWDELRALYRKRIEDSVDDASRLELQLALCFLLEELLDRPSEAIESYQAVLQLDPGHAAARRVLERLYEQTERWRDLAELLRSNLDELHGPERVDTMWRLAQLLETRLGEPASAVDLYESIISAQPHHLRAQQALSGLLPLAEQRQRIAAFLEPLYQEQGAYRDLARVLEIQLDDERDPQTAGALLMRIGELHEQRTRDAEQAFSAYARAVEKDPGSRAARQALARVADSRETFRKQRAQLLGRALETIPDDPALQADLLLERAELLHRVLGDTEAAERVYERLIEIEPDNAQNVLLAARALEPIHAGRREFAKLAGDLERQLQFEYEAGTRERLLVRLAALYAGELSAPDRAIDAQRRRLELDAGNVEALDALARLYEASERWAELVESLDARRAIASDAEERRQLGRRAAALREDRLGDRDGAIAAYSDLLTDLGPDRQTLQALATLYERAERPHELLETLRQEEAWIDAPAEQAEHRFRIAELLRVHTGELASALELYDAVLGAVPDHAGSLAALGSVMNDPQSPSRSYAARVLAPRYREVGAYPQLLSALAVLADSDTFSERLAALRQAADVSEHQLADPAAAFTYIARAVRSSIDEEAWPGLLAELDRLAKASGQYGEYASLLSEIAPLVGDGATRVDLHRKVARIARSPLQNARLALEHYSKLLEEEPDDEEAFAGLQAISEEAGDHRSLIEVLERRATLESDPARRRELRARQAELYEQRLNEPDRAIETLQDLLAEAPTAATFQTLTRLLAGGQRWDQLRAVYEQQLALHIGDAVELRHALARLSVEHLNDPHAALGYLRDALTDDNEHEPSIGLLEQLMSSPGEVQSAAAEALEPIYLGRMQWPKLTASLQARIAAEPDLDERKRLLTRLGQIHEDQLEDYEGAIAAHTRLFREDPRDEDVWETLARLARMSGQWRELGEVLAEPLAGDEPLDEALARLGRHAARIFGERLGDHARAAQLYRRVLSFEPRDAAVFSALETAYRKLEANDQLLELYRQQADTSDSDERRAQLLAERARLFRDVLGQPSNGIASYREVLEIDPDNAAAIAGLEALLVQTEDWSALAEHLRARADRASDPDERLALKNRQAELLETRLHDLDGAIDLYEEVVGVERSDATAIAALERLAPEPKHTLRITRVLDPVYRQLDQWKKLIAVLEAQVELVDDDFERVRLLSEVGDLHEKRGGNRTLALGAWSRAFVCEPAHEEARRRVDRLAAETGAWTQHVATYEAALEKVEEPHLSSSLLTMLARVHDEKRGDFRAAMAVHERMVALDPGDPTPLDALESLHTLVGDWAGLGRTLQRKFDNAFDPQERGELLRRLGAVHEQLLGDREGAIAAYAKAVAEDDTDPLAHAALDRLYTLERKPDDLARVLARRIELEQEPEARALLGLRLGAVLDQQLQRPEAAIAAYERVLDDDRTNHVALAALASAYERREMWSELLDTLQRQRELAAPAARVQLIYDAGSVLERRLHEIDPALDHYRDVLELEPTHADAMRALLRIAKEPEHGARAAELAEPLLRSARRWDELAGLIEDGMRRIDDPVARRMELQRLAQLHEQERADLDAAWRALGRALSADANDDALLGDLERLARERARFSELAELLAKQAAASSDSTVAAELERRLARIYEEELKDDARAIGAFERAAQHEERPETLVALDRLYERTARFADLLQVVERRIGATAEPAARSDLLLRLGDIRDSHLSDGRGAFIAYREVLDADPSDERALAGMERLARHDTLAADVLGTLEQCYEQGGAVEKLARLYELRVRLASSDAERISLLHEAARIYRDELGDPARALPNLRRAFELAPGDAAALDELESLAERSGQWSSMQGLVEGLIERGAIEGQQKRALAIRAAGWYRAHFDPAQGAAAEERCLRWALEVDPAQSALHARLIELLRAPGREADLVRSLLASAEAEPDRAVGKRMLREAAGIAEHLLADNALAASCQQAILDADPDDREALAELARLGLATGDYQSVVGLLERRIGLETDPETRRGLRVSIAELQDERLRAPAAAIAAYRASLDEAPGHDHEQALTALDRLYERSEAWPELLQLLEQRRDRSLGPSRIELRLRLAKLAESRLGDIARATRELVELLDEQADHSGAQDELQALYTRGERWPELIALLSRRAAQATAAGDTRAELAWLRQVAAIYAKRLGDTAKAIDTYASIHERDGSDQATLEALVELLIATEQWEPATRAMRVMLHLRSGPSAHALALQFAEIADLRLQDAALTESALQIAQRAAPDDDEAPRRLRELYERRAMHDKLVTLLAHEEQRTADEKAKLPLLNRIAAIYRDQLHDTKRALTYLERAVALAPDDRAGLLALCDLYVAADRAPDAIPLLRRVIESYGPRRSKEVAIYHHRLGLAYEKQGNVDEAAQSYEAAFRVDLTSVPILRDLGRLCLLKGDLDRAQKTFRALLLQKLGPEAGISKADVYFHLGEISVRQGDPLKARGMLERAIAEAGSHSGARQLLDSLPK